MLVGTLQGVRVWLAKPKGKQDKKDGRPTSSKYLGKVHLPVFTPNGQRIVGFMVKQPDIAGMIKQPDRFVALDAFAVDDDGSLLVADVRESFDAAAAKRLGVDLDACIIWTGMDVQTKSGTKLGYCADASFNYRTGAVDMFKLTPSGASSALIGYLEMPASYLVGYAKGAMVVKDEASQLEFSGGAAAKAAEASVKASEGVKRALRFWTRKARRRSRRAAMPWAARSARPRARSRSSRPNTRRRRGPRPRRRLRAPRRAPRPVPRLALRPASR